MRIDMAQYTIEIEADELEELQQIVTDIHAQQPTLEMTEQSYLQQMVTGFLRDRLTNAYVAFVRQQPVAELRAKLGNMKEIKNGD
jgi:hypothetical protein